MPTVTLTKVSNGGVGPFSFTGTNGFAPQTITTVTPGNGVSGATQALTAAGVVTTLTESPPPAGFTLTSITCSGLGAGGTATPNYPTRTVTLDAAATAAGAAIACTFTNTFAAPPTAPGAPFIGTATAGNAQATVSFTPPTSDGGSPITSYTATSSPGGFIATGASSPLTVLGLANGTSYTFTVRATNSVGTGPPSATSNAVTPAAAATVPGAPGIGTATAGNAQATVAFVPPSSNGGSPITSYTATSSPGGLAATGAASPLTVAGLTNGTSYTFTVRATNSVGTGPASGSSNAVTPAAALTPPAAPAITGVSGGDGRATLQFSTPANGGSPITSYRATCDPGSVSVTGASSPLTITGLTNGNTYSCSIAAINAIGLGPSSSPVSVTPAAAASLPGAPVIIRAAAEDSSAILDFTAPASNGGSAITGYVATCTPGGFTAAGASSPLTVRGLVNGNTYTCVVAAINAIGTGAASAPVTVMPRVPVFAMDVRTTITPTTATVTAAIQPRAQDVGAQVSVFVFALAPATRVLAAEAADVLKVGLARNEAKADTPIACVLAQLNAAGQMVAVSSANLAAYLTGALSAQGASVTILNGVPTGNVSGATFFVGYGTNGTAMINTGVNRAAVTIPGSLTCEPGAPQTGWWWNPLEDGRGFSLEVRGNNMFFAAFLYDISGRSTWYVSSGPASLEGSLYNGDLLSASGGQTLGGPYSRFPSLRSVGAVTLTFNNASTGTMVWPGGTVPIQRFNIVPNGLTLPAVAGTPESGWWWNEQESGRGFFMEWQDGTLDIAGYMYDDNGDPVWYLTVGSIGGTATARSFAGNWWSYTGGQTLTGAWRQNARSNSNVAPLTITFSGPDTALMTLPNGRTTSLRRHRF